MKPCCCWLKTARPAPGASSRSASSDDLRIRPVNMNAFSLLGKKLPPAPRKGEQARGVDDADEEADDEAEELDGPEVMLGDREHEVFELLDGVARALLADDAADVELGDGAGQALARRRLDALGEQHAGAPDLLLGHEVADPPDGRDQELLDLRGQDRVDRARRLVAREHAHQAPREEALQLLRR